MNERSLVCFAFVGVFCSGKDDGTEGTNVANDDACAYYYCNDEKACNYYSDDLTLLYNTDGLALTSTQAQQAIAVGTKAQNICFIPTRYKKNN